MVLGASLLACVVEMAGFGAVWWGMPLPNPTKIDDDV
jgi:hypothetical protein